MLKHKTTLAHLFIDETAKNTRSPYTLIPISKEELEKNKLTDKDFENSNSKIKSRAIAAFLAKQG